MNPLEKLSRTLSRVLRHKPGVWELELDAEGWTGLTAVLEAARAQREEWRELTAAHLERVVEASDKRRFEIQGDRIRALYGHTLPGKLVRRRAAPPAKLFHGTAMETLPSIEREGLLPMRRQYVHLSTDLATALQVARRKTRSPVATEVAAGQACAAGVGFYLGNDQVWLSDPIPPRFVRVLTTTRVSR